MSSPAPQHQRKRRRSLRQDYEEFVLQRIEEFKEQLSRQELLTLADEAVRELEAGSDEQLLLTEVLMLEHVDRLIRRRLRLPSFRRWRDRHTRLREAQRTAAYWGLERKTPLLDLAVRLDESDLAVVVGAGAVTSGFLLVAHDWPVLFIDESLTIVESAETRAAEEELGSRFQALVIRFEYWIPDVSPSLAVLDPAMLSELEPELRDRVVGAFKERTVSGGTHCILPPGSGDGTIHLPPETIQGFYKDWMTSRVGRDRGSRWFLATKP